MGRKQDKYFGAPVQLADPANESVPIVPGTPLDDVSRGLYVGQGGDISMKLGDDDAFRLFENVPDGSPLPFRVKEVQASGTTASGLLALY